MPGQKISTLLLIATVLVMSRAYANNIDYEFYKNDYIGMNKDMLEKNLSRTRLKCVLTGALTLAGDVGIAYGTLCLTAGAGILLAGEMGEDGLTSDIFKGVGVWGLSLGIATLPVGIIIAKIGNELWENAKFERNEIKVALKQFRSVSYNERPGLGLQISIPL